MTSGEITDVFSAIVYFPKSTEQSNLYCKGNSYTNCCGKPQRRSTGDCMIKWPEGGKFTGRLNSHPDLDLPVLTAALTCDASININTHVRSFFACGDGCDISISLLLMLMLMFTLCSVRTCRISMKCSLIG